MRRALVTGAGKRLGRAMALYLAERGFDVAVHFATSRTAAEETAADIAAQGQRASLLQADLLDEAETQVLLSRAAAALGGPITCLVNNASIFEADDIHTATPESWERHIGSNLRAPFVLTQQMAAQVPAPTMDDYDEPVAQGLVVNMIDQRVKRLTPNFFSYTLSKSALWTATRTMAMAYAPKIRINAIGPGPTIKSARQSDEEFAKQVKAVPLERSPELGEFGATIRYFWANKSITGQMIALDGGQHLAWRTPDIQGPE